MGSSSRWAGVTPHCVVIGNDGLVYTCDRGQNRVQVFDKEGTLTRIIPIDPPDYMNATLRPMTSSYHATRSNGFCLSSTLEATACGFWNERAASSSAASVGQAIWLASSPSRTRS